ncbi:hypothetical protein ABLE93_17290 [Xanthobacter sp. KR7-65]
MRPWIEELLAIIERIVGLWQRIRGSAYPRIAIAFGALAVGAISSPWWADLAYAAIEYLTGRPISRTDVPVWASTIIGLALIAASVAVVRWMPGSGITSWCLKFLPGCTFEEAVDLIRQAAGVTVTIKGFTSSALHQKIAPQEYRFKSVENALIGLQYLAPSGSIPSYTVDLVSGNYIVRRV